MTNLVFPVAPYENVKLYTQDGKKTYHVDIFVDKSSVELFVDGGRIAMTNLVFPVAPYENVKLYTQDGKAEFKNLKVHKLGL